jgi:hypothetical protein
MLTLQRHGIMSGGGPPAGSLEWTGDGNEHVIRLQYLEVSGAQQCSGEVQVDLLQFLRNATQNKALHLSEVEERTLSLSQKAQSVSRRVWTGQAPTGAAQTPRGWEHPDLESGVVRLRPGEIRSFAFHPAQGP